MGVLGGRPRLRVVGAASGGGLAGDFGGWTRLPSASSLGFRPGLALGTGLPCSSTFGFGPGLRFGRGLPCLDKGQTSSASRITAPEFMYLPASEGKEHEPMIPLYDSLPPQGI